MRVLDPSQQGSRPFDPECVDDVAELRARTVVLLVVHMKTVPDEIIDAAVEDVIHRRRPRW